MCYESVQHSSASPHKRAPAPKAASSTASPVTAIFAAVAAVAAADALAAAAITKPIVKKMNSV